MGGQLFTNEKNIWAFGGIEWFCQLARKMAFSPMLTSIWKGIPMQHKMPNPRFGAAVDGLGCWSMMESLGFSPVKLKIMLQMKATHQ